MADIRTSGLLDNMPYANQSPAPDPPWKSNVITWSAMKINAHALVGTDLTGSSAAWYDTVAFAGPDLEIWGTSTGDAPLGESYRLAALTDPVNLVGYQIVIANQPDGYHWILRRYTGAGAFVGLDDVLEHSLGANQICMLRLTAGRVQAWHGSADALTWVKVNDVADTTYTGPWFWGMLGSVGENEGWGEFGGGSNVNRPQIYRWIAATA